MEIFRSLAICLVALPAVTSCITALQSTLVLSARAKGICAAKTLSVISAIGKSFLSRPFLIVESSIGLRMCRANRSNPRGVYKWGTRTRIGGSFTLEIVPAPAMCYRTGRLGGHSFCAGC